MMECDFRSWVMKDHAASASFSWIAHSWGSHLLCYEKTQLYEEASVVRNRGLLSTANANSPSMNRNCLGRESLRTQQTFR